MDEVFTEPEEEGARFTWSQIEFDSEVKSQLVNFWSQGTVPGDWKSDPDGVWDFTKLVVAEFRY